MIFPELFGTGVNSAVNLWADVLFVYQGDKQGDQVRLTFD